MDTKVDKPQIKATNETPKPENVDPGVELAHEIVAAALAGIGQVLQHKFTHETLTGSQRKYNK